MKTKNCFRLSLLILTSILITACVVPTASTFAQSESKPNFETDSFSLKSEFPMNPIHENVGQIESKSSLPLDSLEWQSDVRPIKVDSLLTNPTNSHPDLSDFGSTSFKIDTGSLGELDNSRLAAAEAEIAALHEVNWSELVSIGLATLLGISVIVGGILVYRHMSMT